MKFPTNWMTSLVLAGAALGALPMHTSAAPDFRGERIEFLVPYAAGGGADLYARFLAPLIAERLPGSPTAVIKNVEGAGAIAGSNQFQDRAKPDGTNLIVASASVMLNFAFHDARGHYRLDEWIPIINSAQGTVVYSHRSLGLKDANGLSDMAGKTVTLGANNPTGGDLRILLAMDLLGVDVKPVFGLGRGEVYPIFQRGEVNLDFSVNNAFEEQVVPLVKEGIAVPLFTLGITNDAGETIRDPAYPNLPHFLELYEKIKGHPLTGTPRKAWDAIYNLNVMSTRAILLPKDTPAEVVAAYKTAVEKLLADFEKDPKLKETATRVLGAEPQATGEAAARNLRAAVVFDDEAFKWLKDWVKREFDVSL
jgi:tripartite-type tricarboxylate transporter receptor subunit TctC